MDTPLENVIRSFKRLIILSFSFLISLSLISSLEASVKTLPPGPPHHSSSAPGYCPSYGGSHLYEYIESVSYSQKSIDTISVTVYIYIANPTGCTIGELCPEYDNSPEYVNVWIDWDGDKVFESDEKVIDAALTGYHNINYQGTMSISTIVSIPPNSVSSTWMRINLGWGHDPNNPCEQYWTWGDIIDKEVQLTPLELKVSRLDALDDFSIRNITDPIWTDGGTSKPIADGIKNSFAFITWPGSFKIKATIESSPDKPSWKPKVQYSWSISGTDKNEIGILELKDTATGWIGEFEVRMPDKVGKYTLNFTFSIFDDKGKKINSQSMTHTLYATYKNSLLPNPKEIWLDKATVWASGSADPSEVASKINKSIHNAGWLYGYPPSILPYGITVYRCEDSQFGGWPELIELPSIICGDCVKFSDTWKGLVNVLGISGKVTREYGNKKGFVTKSNSIAPDGQKGNAHPQNQPKDRWRFSMHQLGQIGVWFWSKFYDPTFGKEYSIKNEFIEWNQITDFYPVIGSGYWAELEEGHKIRIVNINANYGWGDYEYHSPSEPLNINPNNGAEFTGNYKTYGIDSDGDGIYNLLGADIEINVIQAGDYSIVGKLKSDTGDVITSRSSGDSTIPLGYFLSTSGPGLNIVTLTFSGEDIYNSGADGVYTIELAILDENGLVIDSATFNTSSYSHTEFGEIPARMKVLQDYGDDINGDGLYDCLIAEVDVNVVRAMNYRIEVVLHSPQDGKIIASVNVSQYLDSSQVVKLNFEGIKIRKAGIDGPYILAISLHEESGCQIGYEEYNTSSYQYTDFQLPIQKFTGNYSDYGVDTDGDGLYDYLAVDVGLEIIVTGEYTIEGWLYDKNGNPVEVATTTEHLDDGSQLVVLKFNGISIHQNQVNGPYYVKYLALKGSGIIDFVEDAYTTSSYSFADFQRPPIPLVALTGKYSDCGKDVDADGVFDYLTVEVEVMLAKPGNVVIKGRLIDVDGKEIVWAENTAYLEANQPQIIELDFDGEAIYNHGVDGPYYLKDVYIYHQGDPTQADYTKDAYTTDFYPYAAFGPAEIPGDLDGDGDIDSDDYQVFRSTLGKCSGDTGFSAEADYDGDGCVTYTDYRIWYGYYKSQ